MQALATSLLVLGTILGAFGGARLPQADPLVAGVGLAMLVAGCLLVFQRARSQRTHAARAISDAAIFDLIVALPDQLQPILDQADALTLEEIAQRISALELQYFRPIADASPDMLPRMGAESFSALFGQYAGGERLISRAWSAAVDLHRPETIASLREGIERLRAAARLRPAA